MLAFKANIVYCELCALCINMDTDHTDEPTQRRCNGEKDRSIYSVCKENIVCV